MRKTKPTHIYREETFGTNGYGNSTRQTFNKKLFDAWVDMSKQPTFGWASRFYIGTIDWAEVKEDENE